MTPAPRYDVPMNAPEMAARLAERAEEFCRRFLPRGRTEGNYWKAGNVHGDTGRSLFVGLNPPAKPGWWKDAATGEGGDLLELLRHQYGRDAFEQAREFLSGQYAPPSRPRPEDAVRGGGDLVERMRRMWTMCCPIDGTLAETYLRTRHLSYVEFPALRFHPALYYRDGDSAETFRKLPALVARVTDHRGDFVGVHRTYLASDGRGKAPVASPRKALGAISGAAVWLGPRHGTVVVAEGLETTLTFLSARPGLCAAAALSAAGIAAFVPPAGVTRLVIAPDNDDAGTWAAERLRRRCEERELAAIVLAPEHNDFNDDLGAFGAEVLAARLARAGAGSDAMTADRPPPT